MWLVFMALFCIHLVYGNSLPKWLFLTSRYLPTIVIFTYVFVTEPNHLHFTALLSIGILLAVLADVSFNHLSDRYFFTYSTSLLAHLAFYFATLMMLHNPPTLWLSILIASVGVIIYLLLLPKLASYKFITAIYFIVSIFLLWSSGEYWLEINAIPALLTFLGILFFVSFNTLQNIVRVTGTRTALLDKMLTVCFFTFQGLLVLSIHTL